MYEVMIEEEFSAAHALRGYRGKCENLHGHNWKVEVYVRGEQLDQVGMLVDFKDLKAATRRVMKYLDHQNLNELKPFDIEMNPSSEHLAGFILHVYEGTAAQPGTFQAMTRGTVEQRWAWTHHPAWYRAVTGRDPRADYERAREKRVAGS